jgi:type II secretory pathway component PulK
MALGVALLCSLILFMMGATYLSVVHADLRFQSQQHNSTQAQYLVWAGLEFYVSNAAAPNRPAFDDAQGVTLEWGPGLRVWLKEVNSDGSVEAAGIVLDGQNRELVRRELRLQRDNPNGTGWEVPVNWKGATVAPQL